LSKNPANSSWIALRRSSGRSSSRKSYILCVMRRSLKIILMFSQA